VTELSTSDERSEAHRALAPYASPERRAWHLAEATVGHDEEVASLLEETARKVLRRGDAVAAIEGLRAARHRHHHRTTRCHGPEALSPQQLEIARLAAAGMSNKEIGERLFLSHRTVGSHLYQIFPKLGITSRAALRDALAGYDADP
jgi:DNA-binding NarL/FixJ family response regulator